MEHSGSSDPERIERIAQILRTAIPNATISHQDQGKFGDVAFQIDAENGTGFLLLAWDLLQEDQARTEGFVRQMLSKLSSGITWRISISGAVTPTRNPSAMTSAQLT